MSFYIGADLGTSSLKLLLVDERGKIYKSATEYYDVSYPKNGWSEQNPSDWLAAFERGMEKLTEGIDKSLVAAIGVGGQMHGLVVLDKNDKVIRPTILWNDSRTEAEVEYLNNVIGKAVLNELTANIAFAGFTAPKLLWMYNNEPENFAKIAKIMLPKDYLNYYLTGNHATDYSDASGMLLLDVKNKCWSEKMASICHISTDMLPELYESYEVIGTVIPGIAERLGLPSGVRVVAGAGDNAAAAIGTGTQGSGSCNISLGTSGTVFITSDKFSDVGGARLHSFAHADGGYHLMGCMLSCASCNKWFIEEILGTSDYKAEFAAINEDALASSSVYFLPYLMGERSPINDTNARGTFIGLCASTTRAEMLLAIIEGVCFAIRDNTDIARELGVDITESAVCGGGAKTELFRKILANVLNITLKVPACEEGPAFGGAILAMVASGEYASIAECTKKLVTYKTAVVPDEALARAYDEKYQKYKAIYPALKDVFKIIKE
ncbi:MAG: xylulokinase [Clostridia bacterium]|nr:xylulokinase [Clostridia bacterium]